MLGPVGGAAVTALYVLFAAMWNSVRQDLWTFGRMVVTACSYPFDLAGDLTS